MGDLSRVRVTGPLEPYVSGFIAELVSVGIRRCRRRISCG